MISIPEGGRKSPGEGHRCGEFMRQEFQRTTGRSLAIFDVLNPDAAP
jgi:hypothetical protein